MVDVLGVHGIAQRGARDLSDTWSEALEEGWPDGAGMAPAVDVPYLAGALSQTRGHLGDDDMPFEADEAQFLWQAACEQLGDLDDDALDQLLADHATLGRAVPPGMVAAAGQVDERFGAVLRLTGPVWPGTLREVYRYLNSADVRDDVYRELFRYGDRPAPDLVIGHSLGSVMAYDVAVHRGGVPRLLTVGSPLALRTVREHPMLLVDASAPPQTWVNVYDHADIVAAGKGLAEFWPHVADIEVHNGRDAHGIRPYLSQPQVGAAVAGMLGTPTMTDDRPDDTPAPQVQHDLSLEPFGPTTPEG
ncbi:MAG: hypothetical protein FWF02_12085 [Micrococcales bacterium]|nr:hypothetical protein [Micrococcales bacterium]